MNCKYLSGSERTYCSASNKLMSPSIFELCTFCYGAPTDCLIYQEKENTQDSTQQQQPLVNEESQQKFA